MLGWDHAGGVLFVLTMAIITGKSLADGQLPNSKTALYTVPTGTVAHVTQIYLVNTDSGAITVNIYVTRSGSTSRRILDKALSIAAGGRVQVLQNSGDLRLSAGDAIEGDASTAAKVDYLICGGEEV